MPPWPCPMPFRLSCRSRREQDPQRMVERHWRIERFGGVVDKCCEIQQLPVARGVLGLVGIVDDDGVPQAWQLVWQRVQLGSAIDVFAVESVMAGSNEHHR